ncbi:hypothetical protein Enr13x_23630 [Stieleria neptunia]|uniref:Uncharacterized protein n=1 Tax=Stieleria neptunia TaxID=2527979 RepID=A0A518HNU1_9BACT|nr:hypothetical protein [Stieleria neptunia]QDV42515.1 hypothetical protein Enr13x_23630 [Stieleria neptunia]
MQLDLPRQTVDAIVRKLAEHGLNVNDNALVVRRLLDEMAVSPDGATIAELLNRLRDEQTPEQPQENALELA